MTLISLGGVAVVYGSTTILQDVSVVVARGERWGVVGRNGAGKTTLFDLITGARAPTRGVVARSGTVRITMLDQHRSLGGAATVWDAAAGAFADLIALEHSLQEQAARIGELGHACPPELLSRYGADLERFTHQDGYAVSARVDAILHGLGFDPTDARTRSVDELSGGERGRLALARQLAEPADLLLLDEPTNHLDLDTTAWLEEYLRALDAAVLVVSHDRAFLEGVADHILHVADRAVTAYRGRYSEFVEQVALRRLTSQRAFDRQARTLAAEEDYIRRNIAGGNSAQAKGRRKRLARLPRLSPPPEDGEVMALRLTPAERGGDQVLALSGLRVVQGGSTLLAPTSAVIRRGEVVGLIGPNGIGKSTLLRVILAERPPDGGGARLGDSIRPGYARQDLGQVPLDRPIYDVIHDLRPAWNRGQVQGHLGRFGFRGDEVQRSTATLSGGERSRVALAMLMLEHANFLVLDEPTNHLDVESIEALEDTLERYEGTILLVSHDRAFLRALTTRIWALRDGTLEDYPGTFEEWEAMAADRARQREVEAEERARQAVSRARDRSRRAEAESRDRVTRQRDLRSRGKEATARITALEHRIAELDEALGDPSLYGDGEGARRAAALSDERDRAQGDLAAAWEEWVRVEQELESP